MSREHLEANGLEGLVTEPKLIGRILRNHPEIIQVSMASYPPRDHGAAPSEFYRGYIPIITEGSNLAVGEWRRTNMMVREVVAIGSVVDICPIEGCTHTLQEHEDIQLYVWDRWHGGDVRPYGPQKSFVFLDLEDHTPETLEITREVLASTDCDWYVLDSGGGFHIILDKLVELEDLAGEYGRIISSFGRYLGKLSLIGWGENLTINGKDEGKLRTWCQDALDYCGHTGDPVLVNGKEVHIVDLRYVAHSLLSLCDYREELEEYLSDGGVFGPTPGKIGGAYLRISPKGINCLPPVLVAQRVGQVCGNFIYPFQKDQARQERFF